MKIVLFYIVLKPGPAGQPGTRPIRGWNFSRVEEKIRKEKTWRDPVDPARPGQKLGCEQLIFFFFLLKRHRFDLKKKELTQVTPSKFRNWALDRAGSKNFAFFK